MQLSLKPYVAGPDTGVLSGNIDDYPDGIVIPVDKPLKWTSADVIRKLKYAAFRHFGKKNLKVGHAGTLDPLATGVLIVCIGNATKMAETFQAHDKEYVAGITFGATTPSYDLESEIDRFFPYGHITEDAIAEALASFTGVQKQVAPLFSAKYVDGVRAYDLARKMYAKNPGSLDEAAASLLRVSEITVSETELLSFTPGSPECLSGASAPAPGVPAESELCSQSYDHAERESGPSGRIHVADIAEYGLPHASIRIACSKGTYIRAFARDLGEALGSGAFLHSLCRSRSGDFRLSEALSLPAALSLLQAGMTK